jgi:hypothetical protein
VCPSGNAGRVGAETPSWAANLKRAAVHASHASLRFSPPAGSR